MQQFRAVLAAVAMVGVAAPGAAAPGVAVPGRARAEPSDPGDGVRVAAGLFADALRGAVRGAAARLADPSCAAILDEFEDGSGRRLRERLEALALDASTYARRVLFYDGTNEARCRGNARLHAFTVPGSRVVRACPVLGRLARRDPGRAQAVVIHEVLHTLGLEENPPAPWQITARVERRCGR